MERRNMLKIMGSLTGLVSLAGCLGSNFFTIDDYEVEKGEDLVRLSFFVNLDIGNNRYEWRRLTDLKIIYPNGEPYPINLSAGSMGDEMGSDRHSKFNEGKVESYAAGSCDTITDAENEAEGTCAINLFHYQDDPMPAGEYKIQAFYMPMEDGEVAKEELLGEDSISISDI